MLPYQGEKDSHLTKSLQRSLKSILPSTVNVNIDFTGKKLSTFYEFPKEKLIITTEIKNWTFSSIALKNATNTFTLTVLILLLMGLRTTISNESLRSTTNQTNQTTECECSRKVY